VPRDRAFVTNAVKHFKHEPRGKRRLVKPQLIVALGATAASAVLGRPVAVMKERGPTSILSDNTKTFVTVHPSMLLRIPDPGGKAAAYRDFVRDLTQAWDMVV
jgi:DNA polymerase